MNEFEKKVKEMRRLQKQYFATRNADVLAECKRLEKEVDDMLWLLDHKSPMQMDLFNNDGGAK